MAPVAKQLGTAAAAAAAAADDDDDDVAAAADATLMQVADTSSACPH